MPKVRRIAVSSRVSAANRASELEATTNIQRNRASAVVISSARPGGEMRLLLGRADKLQRHDADMGAAAGRPDLLRAAARTIGGGSRGSSAATRLAAAAAAVAAAACGCPRGRGFPPAASGSRPKARRPADRPARRGSGHRPGSPCRARRARHAPASAPARRPRAPGRSAAAAARPESLPPAPPARAAGLRRPCGRGRAAVRARWSARRRRSDRCRPGPPAGRRPAGTATPAGRWWPASPPPRPPRPCRGAGRGDRGSPAESRRRPGASASSSRWISWRSDARACSSGRRLHSSSASRPRRAGRGDDRAITASSARVLRPAGSTFSLVSVQASIWPISRIRTTTCTGVLGSVYVGRGSM